MAGVPMPIPHYHSRCILGDVDNTFIYEQYAQEGADAENVHILKHQERYAGHREEVIECKRLCVSNSPDIHRKQAP